MLLVARLEVVPIYAFLCVCVGGRGKWLVCVDVCACVCDVTLVSVRVVYSLNLQLTR